MSPFITLIAGAWARLGRLSTSTLLLVASGTSATVAHGQPSGLPVPLGVSDVITYASKHRREIMAASAAARAARQRGRVVSALDDPMVMPSIDHLPFMLHGVDASLMVEQRFYLSNVLDQRRRVADATARGQLARVEVVAQDVKWEAARVLHAPAKAHARTGVGSAVGVGERIRRGGQRALRLGDGLPV